MTTTRIFYSMTRLTQIAMLSFSLALTLAISACSPNTGDADPHHPDPGPGYLNTTYTIEGEPVQLIDGVAEREAAPGSASKVVTRFFGEVLRTGLGEGGEDDVVFILTEDRGGSGTFYYLVAAVRGADGFVGSNGFLLGDRITPQGVGAGPGHSIIVRYLDHREGEPMAEPPTQEVRRLLTFDRATMRFMETH